eukprot:m.173172 g.173172  ORF g.173172 m.173172 type:complete len:118 (+) comp15384_c0_seq7:2576-2929(+)
MCMKINLWLLPPLKTRMGLWLVWKSHLMVAKTFIQPLRSNLMNKKETLPIGFTGCMMWKLTDVGLKSLFRWGVTPGDPHYDDVQSYREKIKVVIRAIDDSGNVEKSHGLVYNSRDEF